MKLQTLLITLGFFGLFSCNKPQQKTSAPHQEKPLTFSWESQVERGELGNPLPNKGHVSLIVNDKKIKISGDPFGKYSEVKASDFSSQGIPQKALTAARAWYAGTGEILYVLKDKEGKVLQVFSCQFTDVEEHKPTNVLVKTIPINSL